MSIVGEWHFTSVDGIHEQTGNFGPLKLEGFAGLTSRGLALGDGSWARAPYLSGDSLREKTLVVWVRMIETAPRQGGSVISLASTDERLCYEPFDGLAFGDTGDYAWLVASNHNQRGHPVLQAPHGDWRQASTTAEKDRWGRLVKIAVTWRDLGDHTEVSVYRQSIQEHQEPGELICLQQYQTRPLVDHHPGQAQVIFGPRFFARSPEGLQPVGHVTCIVAAAQLHNAALDEAELAALAPPLVREPAAPAETFALIIGVQDYLFLDDSTGTALGHSNLQGTLNDVRSYAMLTRLMGVPAGNIRVLTGPKLGPNDFASIVMGRQRPVDMNMVEASFGYATGNGIREGLGWLGAQLRAHPDAQGLVFYAGHSITTTAGHPAFAPLDTRVGAPTAAPEMSATAWCRMSGMVRRLSALIGSQSPAAILSAFHGCFASDGQASVASIAASITHHGADLGSEQTRALLRDLIEVAGTAGAGQEGQDAGWVLCDTFNRVRDTDRLDEDRISTALSGDPLSSDGEYTGLVSMVYAMNTALYPLPRDRAVTFVLETCLPEQSDRDIQACYEGQTLPVAHSNVSVIASCSMGQSSYAGVFDNRWHGAFSWAMTSALSQWDVVVSNAGRYFQQDYQQLLKTVGLLLQTLGFSEQTPTMWSEDWQRQWPVFGRGEWKEQTEATGMLRRVKVKEEIDPGTIGNIYKIETLGGGTDLGFLIVTPILSQPLSTNRGSYGSKSDTWTEGIPTGQFQLVQPDTVPSTGIGLVDWINANLPVAPGPSCKVFTSADFEPPLGSGLIGAHMAVRRAGQSGPPLALVKIDGASELKWYKTEQNVNKLKFITNPKKCVLNLGEVIQFTTGIANPDISNLYWVVDNT
ncbi:MAG: hypothetical protein ACI8RZ_002469 [Myxococcota bacterium]|jgi:hypothetical protein